MTVSTDFPGGNARILDITEDTVLLDTDLRDTTEDWFYWAILVSGAAGKTVTFDFGGKNRIGHFGPAVSHDLKNWQWLNRNSTESCFSYTFGAEENKVYFAHNMVYSAEMFTAFAKENGIAVKTLCKSRRGRDVPFVTIGEGAQSVVLTARHHACESTGSYVVEGILQELSQNPLKNIKVFCVPFVDFDGVVDGDQGKSRAPHDHNRDYDKNVPALYPSVREIRKYIDTHDIALAFDFHSPWHCGGQNDYVYEVRRSVERESEMIRFGEMLKGNITEKSMQYTMEHDQRPNGPWSGTDTPTFACYAMQKAENLFAFTLETCYFGTEDNRFTVERGRELGRCFGKTIRAYLAHTKKL